MCVGAPTGILRKRNVEGGVTRQEERREIKDVPYQCSEGGHGVLA